MIKGKKLAQSFRKEDRLIVRKEKNCFWITDTYILIKLSIKEGKKFLMKWNSYKTTKNLPHLKEDKAYEIKPRREGFIEDSNLIPPLINAGYSNMKEVKITDIIYISDKKLYRVYQYDKNKQGIFNHKYSWIIDNLEYKKAEVEGPNKAVIFKDREDKITGMIMPIRTEKEDYLKELKKVAG